MKRFLSLIICLTLILSMFCGCSDSSSSKKSHEKEVIQFASSSFIDSFALLYSDGTVAVADEYLFNPTLEVLDWQNVEKIWNFVGTIIGLHEDGTVSCTDPDYDFSHLKNVVDICFLEPDVAFYFLLEDNSVDFVGYDALKPSDFDSWTSVKKMIPYGYESLFVINQDGTMHDTSNLISREELPFWTDITDIFFGERIYGLKENGSVVICNLYPDFVPFIPNEEHSLAGAEKIYPFYDIALGLTGNGEVLVSGGEDWFRNVWCQSYDYLSLSDFSEFTDIKQLEVGKYTYRYDDTVALKNDGTVVALDQNFQPYVSQWRDIEKLVVSYDIFSGISVICGLKSDGTVSALEFDDYGKLTHYPNFFMGWQVTDIFAHDYCGIVGICPDGSVVTTNYTTR